jgi:hypothetical protein
MFRGDTEGSSAQPISFMIVSLRTVNGTLLYPVCSIEPRNSIAATIRKRSWEA